MARCIMVQGTMSGAGKSLLAAGLCRIFRQDGYRVAPFKSQNMALNSYITREGLEMGRAQVMQAQACGIEPDVRMNPILLKPTTDVGSQVIVGGKVRGVMPAGEYFRRKTELIPDIMRSYRELSEAYDIIVIEGAGSPAELNLKQNDIVNMGMAEMADAPVLLVGDIDRGGVFAQLIGTVMLLEEKEKARIRGLVINKFRGDKTILDPGIEILKERSGIPVVGCIPYLQVDLEDEDSLTERFGRDAVLPPGESRACIDITVIRLPRISNFTDFMILESDPRVHLTYADRPDRFGTPDLVILPGTKNTMGDLKWLRESGLEGRIKKAAGCGVPVFGICGGYQMLGEGIEDPEGVEEGGSIAGLGLLPVRTVFGTEKTRTRVSGRAGNIEGFFAPLSGAAFSGYEIHMGQTFAEAPALSEIADEITGQVRRDGAVSGNVLGTYVHGIFDEEGFGDRLLRMLAEKKGIAPGEGGTISLSRYREQQFDILAEGVRRNMDMNRIYEILEGKR